MSNGKQKRKEIKEQSQRLSYIDCLNHQKKLRKFVEAHRRENKGVHSSERDDFIETISKAFCGEGLYYQCYLPIEHGKVPLNNLHYFGHKLAYLYDSHVVIEHNDKKYEGDISILWGIFLDGLLYVFPFAQRQAYSRSAEKERYERGGALSYEPGRRY